MFSFPTDVLQPAPYPPLRILAPRRWQDAAADSYAQSAFAELDALRNGLAARVAGLTGRAITPQMVLVDRAAREASVAVDGVLFRLTGGQLSVVRPCALCGTGAVASPPIASRADLGYALTAWEPRCPSCGPDDEEDWARW